MNSNNQKVVTVLVSHFNETEKKTVVNHLSSFQVNRLTSENLFAEIDRLFLEFNLPWKNLLSILMDSCRVMRGSKKGLEALIRSRKAPHLLDVDGDTCHHAHNAAKTFCSPFGRHVELMLHSLHTDFHWSPYHRELLFDVCISLNIKPTTPEQYVPHRWLSLLAVATDTLRLFDAYTVYYYCFLHESDQALYREVLENTLEETGAKKEAIQKLQNSIKQTFRSLTKEGKERKIKLAEKMFVHREKTLLILNLYTAVLPILNKYVVFFQKKEPLMHKLHCMQEELLKEFLSCFVKPEQLQGGPSQLLKIDLDSKTVLLPPSHIFAGRKVQKAPLATSHMKSEFMKTTLQAYFSCRKELLKKKCPCRILCCSASALLTQH